MIRTYAKTLYIAHDNFDELHPLSHALAQLCGTQSPNYFIQKPLVIQQDLRKSTTCSVNI